MSLRPAKRGRNGKPQRIQTTFELNDLDSVTEELPPEPKIPRSSTPESEKLSTLTKSQLVGTCVNGRSAPTCLKCHEPYGNGEEIMWYHDVDNNPAIEGAHCAHSAHVKCHYKYAYLHRANKCVICDANITKALKFKYDDLITHLNTAIDESSPCFLFPGGKRKSKRQTKKRCCSHKNKTKHCKGKNKKNNKNNNIFIHLHPCKIITF
jgi:hypothetical protein